MILQLRYFIAYSLVAVTRSSHPKNYYELLGVGKNATKDEIKKAFKSEAVKTHPDKIRDAEATEKFKALKSAYDTLYDDKSRLEYDQRLKFSSPKNQTGNRSPRDIFEFGKKAQFGTFRIIRTDRRPRCKRRHFFKHLWKYIKQKINYPELLPNVSDYLENSFRTHTVSGCEHEMPPLAVVKSICDDAINEINFRMGTEVVSFARVGIDRNRETIIRNSNGQTESRYGAHCVVKIRERFVSLFLTNANFNVPLQLELERKKYLPEKSALNRYYVAVEILGPVGGASKEEGASPPLKNEIRTMVRAKIVTKKIGFGNENASAAKNVSNEKEKVKKGKRKLKYALMGYVELSKKSNGRFTWHWEY